LTRGSEGEPEWARPDARGEERAVGRKGYFESGAGDGGYASRIKTGSPEEVRVLKRADLF